ncbi:MAG: DUF4870 domain-containing protein [Chloroflexi bacterium]|nr:DUF4870 domain-containing protein [Chloroflexota bacterium]
MNEQMSQQPPALPLTPQEERQWAMLAHLGVLANLFSGFLGPAVPLAIYLIYKDRSRYVAYQSLQGLVFQLIWWVGGGALTGVAWAITGTLSTVLIGLLCIPVACVISAMPLVALVYGVYGGIQCNQGADFKYWLIGDWFRNTLNG